ncbi:VHS domain containing protein [Coccidioides posadasii C735 delta SOWgp]|uniref:Vacuolar protein sorting-associated protein 27 n=1 Tax=Coccidioides posadasii (strain C735) TaxID=222929 RepID=C5PGZ3_COCP7|nr:VHS domain containing protein [Coccidioides posadasii C735 delta SOWgp]EER23796.1 VHS domain containing protein [Coccidioides posadasii C735 delta SOWgp]|eukprot:XP_003065941.1 VHS domain containing protein [Coccidioides posadasii C735 delta SOWgp]
MAGWFSSVSPFEEQVEKATASSLEDIALNLEITDLIRSKTVQPKEAMKLTDTCVKNGGRHFLLEISSREFMDNLVSLLKTEGPNALNDSVKTKILDLIQSWALATESRSELAYVGETYRKLQWDGFQFPPKTELASSMLDSSAPVRVDDGCYAKLTSKSFNPPGVSNRPGFKSPKTSARMEPRGGRAKADFDEDLKRALQLSLEDAKGKSSSGYVPQSKPTPRATPSKTNENVNEEEEDSDLKAAIEASLKDMEEQKRKHTAALKNSTSLETPGPGTSATVLPKKDYELTATEAEKINLLATLVDRLQHQPPGTILREPQIQELYESIGALRPKLARTYGETMSKYDTLLDLHAKLSTVVRYYDRMLEERLSNTYAQQTLGAYDSLQPAQSSTNLYPTMSSHISDNQGGAESFYLGSGPDRQFPHAYPPMSRQSSVDQYEQRSPSAAAGTAPGMYARPVSQYNPPRQPWNQPTDTSPQIPSPHQNRSLSYSNQPLQHVAVGGQMKQDSAHPTGQQPPFAGGQYPQSPVTFQNSQYSQPIAAAASSGQQHPPSRTVAEPLASPPPAMQSTPSYAFQGSQKGGPYEPTFDTTSPPVQYTDQYHQPSYHWQQTTSATQNAYPARPINGTQISEDTSLPTPQSPYQLPLQPQPKPVEESLIEL